MNKGKIEFENGSEQFLENRKEQELERLLEGWRICPCKLADEPCHPSCTCVKQWMSRGCLCCTAYGSAEQRKAAANEIVKICKERG